MNKKKILMSIVGLLIIAIGLSSAYYKTITDKDNSVDTSTVSDKTENVNKYQDIIDEYDTNKAINAEFTGFIRFESGIIDEPFVLPKDDDIIEAYDKYLRTAWDTMSEDPEGTVFMDPYNTLDDQNLVLYGHYVYPSYEPSMTHMFTPLHLLKDEKNYEENRFIDLIFENEIRRYEVAHVYYARLYDDENILEEGMEYMYTSFDSEGLEYYLKRVKEEEFYNTGVEIGADDRFLTLQTCVEDHDELRLIIVAKEIEIIKTR